MNFRAKTSTATPLYFHVTPFVDILLVLLAFFALTWSVRTTEGSLKIALPEARNAQPSTQAAGRIIVNIQEDGTIVVQNKARTPDELHALLQTFSASNPHQMVVIRADEKTDYQNVLRVLDTCRGAKIINIGFAAAPKDKK